MHDLIADHDSIMASASAYETLFVDPAVSDPATILVGLRSKVEAIVLDAVRPPGQQLAGRQGFAAMHVIAHSTPDQVSFAGKWSEAILDAEADDLTNCGAVGIGAMSDRDGKQIISCARIGG